MKKLIFSAISISLFASCAQALIVYGKDNESTKVVYDVVAEDSGYAVVNVAGRSAVYLGNGWFVTANHVPVTEDSLISQNGESVKVDYVDATFSSEHSNVDLKLFYSASAEHTLNYLTAAVLNVSASEFVSTYSVDLYYVGGGLGRDENSSVTDSIVPWGANTTMAVRTQTDRIDTMTTSGEFDFFVNFAEPTEGSIALAERDSGSGLFFENSGTLYLVGIAIGTSKSAETDFVADKGGTYSLYLDVKNYVADINSIISTTPVPEPSTVAALTGLCALLFAVCLRKKHR